MVPRGAAPSLDARRGDGTRRGAGTGAAQEARRDAPRARVRSTLARVEGVAPRRRAACDDRRRADAVPHLHGRRADVLRLRGPPTPRARELPALVRNPVAPHTGSSDRLRALGGARLPPLARGAGARFRLRPRAGAHGGAPRRRPGVPGARARLDGQQAYLTQACWSWPLYELRVEPVLRQQRRVRALLAQPPLVEDRDQARASDRREPVGDHQAGAALEQQVERGLDQRLVARVERARRPRRGSGCAGP